MKTPILILNALALCLLAVPASASHGQHKFTNPAIETRVIGNSAIISRDMIEIISEPRYIETKSRKRYKKKKKKAKRAKSIAQIRNEAIKNSLGGLRELRPYTKNYKRLQAAVRRYWRRSVRRPNANALGKVIMRHVKRKSRKLVRSEVFSGARSGVRKVQKQLRKRRR